MDAEVAARAFEALACPAAVFSDDLLTVRLANAAARRALGLRQGAFDQQAPGWSALCALIGIRGGARAEPSVWNRLVDGRHEPWLVQAESHDFGLLITAQDLTPHRVLEAQREQQAAVQRELLLREVHHRLKNSLQGVAGLLDHLGADQPMAQPALQQAAAQVRAVAEVYGLSGRSGMAPDVAALSQSLCSSLGALFSKSIAFEHHHAVGKASFPAGVSPQPASLKSLLWAHLEHDDGQGDWAGAVLWRLRADDAPAIALCLNELLTNALKHAAEGGEGIRCEVHSAPDGVEVQVRNPGALPVGFERSGSPQSLSGLGLVAALLPRRGARLEMDTQGGEVCARLHIGPPCALPEPVGAPQSDATR